MRTQRRGARRFGLLVVVALIGVGVYVVVRRPSTDEATTTGCRPLLLIEARANNGTAAQRTFLGREGKKMQEVGEASLISDAALSPDGTELAVIRATQGTFTDAGPERSELWIIRPDGTVVQRLATGGEHPTDPQWSPDGRSILVSSTRPEADPLISVVPADGSGKPRAVMSTGKSWSPVWSPAGTTIAYLAATDLSRNATVATVSADGKTRGTIATDRPFANAISFAPDGTALLVTRTSNPPFGISTLDRATGEESTLLSGTYQRGMVIVSPQWASDSTHLYWGVGGEVHTGRLAGGQIVDERIVVLPTLDLEGAYITGLDVGPC